MPVPTISSLPEAPDINDPANFPSEASAHVASLSNFVDELNAFSTYLNNNDWGSIAGVTTRPAGIQPGGIWSKDNGNGTYSMYVYDGSVDHLVGDAALTPRSDRISYFTGQYTKALATFTAQARSFVAQSTASGQRGVMGLGSCAVRNFRHQIGLGSNDAWAAPSQQSVKQYVDARQFTDSKARWAIANNAWNGIGAYIFGMVYNASVHVNGNYSGSSIWVAGGILGTSSNISIGTVDNSYWGPGDNNLPGTWKACGEMRHASSQNRERVTLFRRVG